MINIQNYRLGIMLKRRGTTLLRPLIDHCPLKILVQIFENEDRRSSSSEVGNGLMKQININKENKTCGIDFYKYVTSMFDKNTKEYKLVQRIASTEGIDIELLERKTVVGENNKP